MDQLMAPEEDFDQAGAVTTSMGALAYAFPVITAPESQADITTGGTRSFGFVA